MLKYGVRDFDLDTFLSLTNLTEEDFDNYVNFIAENYPNGIPDNILNNIVYNLNEGNYDLQKLFTVPGFNPSNLAKFQSELVQAVRNGKDQSILSLINYSLLPPWYCSWIQWNRTGP